MPTRPFTDIQAAISTNPVKNGTLMVHARFGACYNSSTLNILMNGNYTDLEQEAPNLVAAINSFGYSYSTFTDISESTFSSFSGGTLVIPELQGDDLDAALTSGAKDAIEAFVSDGGTLLTFKPNSNDLYILLNNIFDFSLSTNSVDEPINLTTEGLSLLLATPSTISDNDGTGSLDTTTLPPDSVTIYEGDNANQSVVTMMPYGEGKIYVLGWDWYDGAPLGSQDNGWLSVLNGILSLSPCSRSYYQTYNRYVKEYPTIATIDQKYGNRFYNGIFVAGVDNGTI
jgi:hypothetical protein